MSVAWYIDVPYELSDLDVFVSGKAIAHCDEVALEALCEALGVRSLTDFLSVPSAVRDDFIEDFSAQEPDREDETWFSAEEGLESVEALLEHFDQHADVLEEQEDIVSDLLQYQEVLSQLKKRDIKWHLAVDA